MEKCTLRDTTLELLHSTPRTIKLKDIATGAEIPETWLKSFNRGKTEHPSVVYILKLYEYLTRSKLI